MTEDVLNNTAVADAPTVPEKKVMRLEKVGKVVSNKMEKTIVVEVSYLKKHRLYKKAIRRTSRFKAHDEQNECKIGDVVRIEECRPISKEKHFRLAEIIKHSDRV
ncbi:MAG: 30S ribosomal protein S17 [Chloroflexota bacterium]